MKKVIGLGNALVDILIALPNNDLLEKFNLPLGSMTLIDEDRLFEITEAIQDLEAKIAAGGSAANTINGLANTNIETAFIGKIGDDEMGHIFKEDMQDNGITPYLGISSTPSGRAIAFVSPNGERTFATYLGASLELDVEDVKAAPLADYDLMYIEGYLVQNEALIRAGIAEAKKAGLKVALDLASYNVVESNLELLQSLLKDVDFVFANEEEAKAFCNETPEKAVLTLGNLCEYAIVKCGADGSLIHHNNAVTKIGVIEVSPIDTTGAGDLFAAGFLSGLLQARSISESGEAGALLAGKVIEVMGPKLDEETWKYIRTQLNF